VRRGALSGTQAIAAAAALILALSLADCTVGPDYSPDATPAPTHYKELKGWKTASPRDGLDRGDWWRFYRDPKLAVLLKQVEISNQTVAAAAAAYEQARAVIREAQAALFPVATASYTATRTGTGINAGGGGVGGAGGGTTISTYNPQLSGSWDLDVWGKVRRQIESNTAAAQASAADLANAKLSAQAQLATAYFNLRTADSLRDLLARTVKEDQETLRITQDKFKAGYCPTPGGANCVSEAELRSAEALVLNAQAQEINVGVQRAQFEHAIAILIGRPPAELTIAAYLLGGSVPKIPVAVPSSLLERRPDVAAAERTMQEQNALIGVAIAAYFPDITLTGMLQWIGTTPFPFNVANAVWSLGAAGTETLIDGGLRAAQVDAARAVYWQSVASYRQTVLTAFQQVEDQLAALRILKQQLVKQQAAVKAQRDAVRVYLNQYRAGTIDFTTVVTAQLLLLSYEEAELTIRQDLFLASVSLIEALGGGWDTNLLPAQQDLVKDVSVLPQY
jgi:NodT family efflux transporter outer membrane factor (OMF) lipoprotein